MRFTVYIDESDTHGNTPNIVVAGFLGHAYQWRRFGKKLALMQKKYGFTIFHATEFAGKTGEFKGWSDEKCLALVAELTDLVQRNLTEGFTIELPHVDYVGFAASSRPDGMRLDTQYAACMRGAVAHLLDVLSEYGPATRMDVVLEAGHKHAGDAKRAFDYVKKILEEFGDRTLGDFSTARKAEALPLMVADFLAFTHSKARAGNTTPPNWRPSGGEPWRKEPRKAGLSHLLLTAEGLARLSDNFEALEERRKENWKSRRNDRRSARADKLTRKT